MNTLPNPVQCCDPCESPVIVNIAGPPGLAGGGASNGVDGQSAFTTLTAPFEMPAFQEPSAATVLNSDWMALGQLISLNGSIFRVSEINTSTDVTLTNLATADATMYPDNAAPGTVFAEDLKLVAAGPQGPTGAGAAGALLAANNLLDIADAATARSNLGLGTMAVQSASAVAITGGTLGPMTDVSSLVQIQFDLGIGGGGNVATSTGAPDPARTESWIADTSVSPNQLYLRVAGTYRFLMEIAGT